MSIATKKSKKKTLGEKLKAAMYAVWFMIELKKRLKKSLLQRKRKAQKYSEMLLQITGKMVNSYYEPYLK